MPDVYSKAVRSQVMSRIRKTDTKPELAVRRILHRLG
jgi:G:T-mismatch repair DNA endonuclease (very short patch repair protein)